MDPLGNLLDGVRAHTAAFCRAVLDPPWGLRIEDGALLAFASPIRGHAWVVFDDGEAVLIEPGGVAIVRGPQPYTVADNPDTAWDIRVLPGNRLYTRDGTEVQAADLQEGGGRGARSAGSDRGGAAGAGVGDPRPVGGGDVAAVESRPGGGDVAAVESRPEGGDVTAVESRSGGGSGVLPGPGTTTLASGTYQVAGHVNARLLALLPRVVHVPRERISSSLLDLFVSEIDRDEPGQQVVLDRLLDLALIAALRVWLSEQEGWYRAYGDPLVGPALRLVHDDPARPWTVEGLAVAAGASRAAFARRFTELVGQPPMTYLTHWRLDLAASALRTSDATVHAIARQVGYANAFALTVAFKRVRGTTPSEHRTAGGRPSRTR
ncbi:MAG TPA: AraC family transcriptional regulator [Actinoplanes sp.]|nr:AraC family transcriptional regulator [Actinoplanes sp.]